MQTIIDAHNMSKVYLKDNWKFKLGDDYNSSDVPKEILKQIKKWNLATVPGTIHTDLLQNNLIDEPFFSDNELRLGWISECDWMYQAIFDLPRFSSQSRRVRLVFDGVDTIAEIWLNDEHLGNVENMFRKYEFDVTDKLEQKKNILSVKLLSPMKTANAFQDKYGKLPVALNSERVYLRKAQYSFGWDWGPSFATSGIWKDVYLEQIPSVELINLSFSTLELTDCEAEVKINFTLTGNVHHLKKARIILEHANRKSEKEILFNGHADFSTRMIIEFPALWFPNGEGEQSLYNLQIELLDQDENSVLSKEKTVGIRKLELCLEENGKPSFRFLINNKSIFARGVNWIPADSFLPRVSCEKYYKILRMVKEANANIVRVWGGGVYETDCFYEICDELGLLVWQDFMFACGSYPEHEEFLQNVKNEIRENVYRLQTHPCLAIWCGNNENEWLWYQHFKTSYVNMPGYKIYHDIIPGILKEIDPAHPYWQSSPFGDEEDPNIQGSGNNHQWEIWSRWIDYDEVTQDQSLFVTEFGFQGPANISTLNKAIPQKNRKTFDKVFEHHNKQVEGTERIFRFISAHLPVHAGWEEFIYLGQLNQALALKTCVEHWRLNSPKTNGCIIWQMNDCWPVTSWALVDSNLLPKISYHFVKNAFVPQLAAFKKKQDGIDVLFLNQHINNFRGKLLLKQFNITSGREINSKSFELDAAHYSKEIVLTISDLNYEKYFNSVFVSFLYDEGGLLLHKNFFYLHQWKHAPLAKIQLKKNIIKQKDGYYLCISSDKPAFFVDFYHPKLTFSERAVVILPGETIKIKISGKRIDSIKPGDISQFTLNDFLNT